MMSCIPAYMLGHWRGGYAHTNLLYPLTLLQERMVDGHFFLDKEGPYKTMNDLWDGERSILCGHEHGSVCYRQHGDMSSAAPWACMPSKACRVLHASLHHQASQSASMRVCTYTLLITEMEFQDCAILCKQPLKEFHCVCVQASKQRSPWQHCRERHEYGRSKLLSFAGGMPRCHTVETGI